MEMALRRAGLDPSSIDYVNAHGTGTKDNDLAESRALKKLFGQRLPLLSSTKRFFGHALAASGAMEAVVCVEALRRQAVPPNPGFHTVDPLIGIEPVTASQPARLTHVLSNSFGFGGNNAVLLFSRPEAGVRPRLPEPVSIRVRGLGVVGPGAVTVRAVDAPLPPGKVTVHDCGALPDVQLLSPNQRRRSTRLMQMALIAARRSGSQPSPPAQSLAVVVGTGMGSLQAAEAFIENMISKEEREPMPALFPASVHNAAAAQVAMDWAARGLNAAPTTGEISFECALWLGMSQLRAGEAAEALVGAADELDKYVLGIGRRWGFWTEKTRPGEGAVMVRLGPDDGGAGAARVQTVRLGRFRRPFDAGREAAWVASAVDLSVVDVVVSGAGGSAALDPLYAAWVEALSVQAGRTLEHQTYKPLCGEFHSASAFGFSQAVELVSQGRRGVLICTLSLRGAKALCLVQP
jgi:acyl transferase domain-containing protein